MPKYRWSGTAHGRKTSGEMVAHSEGELRAKLGKLIALESVEMLSSDVDASWHAEAPPVHDRPGPAAAPRGLLSDVREKLAAFVASRKRR